jgi:hypothetical protein
MPRRTSRGNSLIEKFEEGARDAFWDTVQGIVVGGFINVALEIMKTTPYVPSYYTSLLQLLQVVILIGSIFAVFQIESWRFMYLLGWLIAMWFLYSVNLVESWLFILYAVVGIPVLLIRILKQLGLQV